MALRPCLIEECEGLTGKRGTARGLCSKHYSRWQKYGDALYAAPPRERVTVCTVDGCDLAVKAIRLCSKHHTRLLRYGSPTARLKGEVVDGKRICPGCGGDKPLAGYSPHRGTKSGFQVYCKPCSAARTHRSRQRPEFVRTPRDMDQARDYARRWREAHPDAVRSFAAARRARRQAATTEKFSVAEIFQRDNWTCHLCGSAIDRELRFPDSWSASLDHVIPLSKGGAHSRANCAASHLFCNISKKDRVAA
jgi:5-methylcytosine-specific restriction endonuclease McrA